MQSAAKSFNVTLHDVTPFFEDAVRRVMDALEPIVGRRLGMAVVPRWHGRAPCVGDERFWSFVGEHAGEVLLHGYEHVQPRFSGVAGVCKANEMRGLDENTARERIERGQGDLLRFLGTRAEGFLAPAYERGGATDAALEACGFSWALGWGSVRDFSGRRQRLATYVWDVAPVRGAGYLGEAIGHFARLRPGVVPALAVHPQDIERGYLGRVVRIAERLVGSGHVAVSAGELLGRVPAQAQLAGAW